MAGLSLKVITPEREALDVEDVEIVVAPGIDGQLGILRRHAPLITQLEPGTLYLRHGGEERFFSITGGFLEVMDDTVTVLADASERADEIDLERAQRAREAAQRDLESAQTSHNDMQVMHARLALLRAMARVGTAVRARSR